MDTPSTVDEATLRTFQALFAQARTDVPEEPLAPVLKFLLGHISDDRPLLVIGGHPDNGVLGAGGLMADVRRKNLPVIDLALYSGHRSPGFPACIVPETRARIRRLELWLEGLWLLRCRIKPLALPSYAEPGYRPGADDFGRVIRLFAKRRPGAVLCPDAKDRNPAHRAARALAAVGLLANELADVPVISYWSPSGPLSQPNMIHACSRTAARLKRLAIAAHGSQRLNADYATYNDHMSRAYVPLVRQLRKGFHGGNSGNHRPPPPAVELYRREVYVPAEHAVLDDPIQTVLGILAGHLDPFPPFRKVGTMSSEAQADEARLAPLIRQTK